MLFDLVKLQNKKYFNKLKTMCLFVVAFFGFNRFNPMLQSIREEEFGGFLFMKNLCLVNRDKRRRLFGRH